MSQTNDHHDPIPKLLADCDAVERRWFLENFYPNYHLIIDILLDLEEASDATHDEFGRATGSDAKWQYSIEQVAGMHGLSAEWVERNVTDIISYRDRMKTPRHTVDDSGTSWTPIKEAAMRYAAYTAEANPYMPMCRIIDAVLEFVPSISDWIIRRRLNDLDLNTDVRRERTRWSQRHIYCADMNDEEYEQYLDRLSFDPNFEKPKKGFQPGPDKRRSIPDHIVEALQEGGEDYHLSLRKASMKHNIAANTVKRIRNKTGCYSDQLHHHP